MFRIDKVLIYAIVPAIIAGFFSLAPKIYDILTEPKSELLYKIVEGPGLDIKGNTRKIFLIEVRNNGRKALNDIKAELIVIKGQIEHFKINDSSGIKPIAILSQNTLSIDSNILHPSESFFVSAMLLMPEPSTSVKFNLRSNEVLGRLKNNDNPQKYGKIDLLGAVSSGFSVFFMVMLLATGRIPLKTLILGHKQDILYYIAIRVGFNDLVKNFNFFDSNLSYHRTAEIFLATGLGNKDQRESAIIALESMLLVKNIANTSLDVIGKNISILSGSNITEDKLRSLRKQSIRLGSYLQLREKIDNHIEKAKNA